jgi:hypothetical protein
MLYRVHARHNANGSIGQSIGYITICPSFGHVSFIYNQLHNRGFTHLLQDEVNIVATLSVNSRENSYSIKRRRGLREEVLFLVPVEKQVSKPLYNDGYEYDTDFNQSYWANVATTVRPEYRVAVRPVQNQTAQVYREVGREVAGITGRQAFYDLYRAEQNAIPAIPAANGDLGGPVANIPVGQVIENNPNPEPYIPVQVAQPLQDIVGQYNFGNNR